MFVDPAAGNAVITGIAGGRTGSVGVPVPPLVTPPIV